MHTRSYGCLCTFSDQNISDVIDSLASQVEGSQARNFQRWSNVSPRFGSWEGEVENMRDWLLERAEFMDDQFAPNPTFLIDGQPIPSDVSGVSVSQNQPVVITPPPQEVFTDTVIFSGNTGATTARYMVPTNNQHKAIITFLLNLPFHLRLTPPRATTTT